MDSFSPQFYRIEKKTREIRGSSPPIGQPQTFLGRRRGSKFSSGKGSSISRPGNTAREGRRGRKDPNDRSPSRSLKYRLENGTTAVRREKGGGGERGGGGEGGREGGREVRSAVKTFRLEFRNDRRASLSGNNICTACT